MIQAASSTGTPADRVEIPAIRRPAVSRSKAELPRRNPVKIRWFASYSRRYLAKHFHAVRLSRCVTPRIDPSAPLIVYLNHASWWDPLVCLILHQALFPDRAGFAPIDAEQLDRYGIFRGLGFFGVDAASDRGGIGFLRTSGAILDHPGTVLWLTPQGRFADVRERPVDLLPGLAHLAYRHPHAQLLPIALEYPFWQDRLPEVLVRMGSLSTAGDLRPGLSIEATRTLLGEHLAGVQDALAVESLRQDPELFRSLIGGRAGVGGLYDLWRRLRSWVSGKEFVADHSEGMS